MRNTRPLFMSSSVNRLRSISRVVPVIMFRLFVFGCFIGLVVGEYEFPDERVEILSPRGFRVSIPGKHFLNLN